MVWSTYSSSSTLSGVLSIHFTNIKNYRVQFQGILIIELWAAGWDARKLPLCYPPPTHTQATKVFETSFNWTCICLNCLIMSLLLVEAAPKITSLWPFMYLAAEYIQMSAPSSRGRCNEIHLLKLSFIAFWRRLDLTWVLKLILNRLVKSIK